jgi:virginiamycin B lyase
MRRVLILALVTVSFLSVWMLAQASHMPAGSGRSHPLLGGVRGMVQNSQGRPLEGIGVQLISPKTAIRTTVYTSQEGYYEFPVLQTGSYTLRIARPLEFQPYLRESVRIEGAKELETIVLKRVSESEFLPPTPEILGQLTGAEWMMNLPGTGKEKRTFTLACGFGCHSYQQIFRARYDERSWRLITHRMLFGSGSPLINMRQPTPERRGRSGLPAEEEEEIVFKWLARVRGPESEDSAMHILPRERGPATRVIITEYELPRMLLAPHDVHGDSQGRIWYTPHRSPYIGALDPQTGKVEEYRVPDTPGALPGTHRVWVDERDIVYVSENWAHNLTRFDPRTQTFKQFHFEEAGPLNSPGFSNFAMDPSGYVYETLERHVIRIDRDTGKIVQRWPLKEVSSTYDNITSLDGRYWSGGPIGDNIVSVLDMQTGELTDLETGRLVSSPARGGFDHKGIAWLGGRGGMLLRIDPRALHVTEYFPPIPHVAFYEMLPDNRGEVWGTALHSGRFLRFNPEKEQWTAYMLPEPFSHNRRTWIDNSTEPVTVWYVDHNGYMVRIQPLE